MFLKINFKWGLDVVKGDLNVKSKHAQLNIQYEPMSTDTNKFKQSLILPDNIVLIFLCNSNIIMTVFLLFLHSVLVRSVGAGGTIA